MKHKLALLGLALFLAADVFLFIAVRQHVDDTQVSSSDDESPSAPASAASPSAAGEDDDSTSAGAQALDLAGPGLLARVSRGRCLASSRPLLELSTDRGKTFNEVALPLLGDVDTSSIGAKVDTVRTILDVRAESVDEITVIGSDDRCRPRRFDTDDGGESWKQSDPDDADVPDDAWYIDAAGTGVVSPDGSTDPGCRVVAVAPVSDRNAKIACSGGTIGGTDDNGDEWVVLGVLEKVSAMTFTALRDGFAVAPDEDCASRFFTTKNTGAQWQPEGCIDKDSAATSLVGSVGRFYALVDGDVQVSTDQGETWEPAAG